MNSNQGIRTAPISSTRGSVPCTCARTSAGRATLTMKPLSVAGALAGNLPDARSTMPSTKQATRRTMLATASSSNTLPSRQFWGRETLHPLACVSTVPRRLESTVAADGLNLFHHQLGTRDREVSLVQQLANAPQFVPHLPVAELGQCEQTEKDPGHRRPRVVAKPPRRGP